MDHQDVVAYIPNLRRYARALAGDPHAADDLVQDTLERAVRKFHLWRPGDLRAWLFAIMHNVYMNQLRARPGFPAQELDDEMPGTATADSGVAMRDIERGLATLTPEQREVVLLVTLEDFSYEQAGRALGLPIGTVMSRLSRGRERLRAYLDGEPVRTRLKVVR